MMSQLVVRHSTNGMDEVTLVQVLKPILVQIVGVGTMVEVMSRRIFNSILIMSILWEG